MNRRAREEEDCTDRVCSETKSSMKRWMRNKHASQTDPQCPLDRNSLGTVTWSLLHTIAASYPKKPSDEQKTDMKEFIRLISVLYPCSYCAKDFREDIQSLPPNLESQYSLQQWFCRIHNKVNKKLNKPEFDCSRVDERWRTGWKDGSCFDM